MGNLVGVVAAISAGGAGAVFWMWVTALIGSSTAFVEATLAQIYKEKDPVYGGYRGTGLLYAQIHTGKAGRKKETLCGNIRSLCNLGLICWCGISPVISNSVTSAFHNAFHIPPIYTTVVLVALGGSDHFSKNCNGKSAGCAGTGHGRMLFFDYCDFNLYEFFCSSGSVFQNL